MKNKNNQFYFLFTSLVFLTGCSLVNNVDSILPNNNPERKKVIVKENLQVTISCNKENIQNYIDKGWKILDQQINEVPCTWKTVKANKDCNLKRDKGCAIKVPDIKGEQIIYRLTREKLNNEISE